MYFKRYTSVPSQHENIRIDNRLDINHHSVVNWNYCHAKKLKSYGQLISSILLLLLWLKQTFPWLHGWKRRRLVVFCPSDLRYATLCDFFDSRLGQSRRVMLNPISSPLHPTSEVRLSIKISFTHTHAQFQKWKAHNGCPGSTSHWLVYHFALCEYKKILYECSLRVTSRTTEKPPLSLAAQTFPNPGWGQFAEETLITVEHAPIDVINQVNEAQRQ